MVDINSIKVIAVLEVTEDKGGPTRLLTRSFDQSEPIWNIVDWALSRSGNHGKLVLTVDGLDPL